MNSTYRFALLFSLFIHLCVYLALTVGFEDIIKKTESSLSQSRAFVLTPIFIEHKPVYKTQEPKGPGPTATQQATSFEPTRKAISSTNSSYLNDLQTTKKLKNVERQEISNFDDHLLRRKLQSSHFNRLKELDDNALDNSLVQSPLDNIEEQKANWYRELMHHLNKLIALKLVKTEGSSSSEAGVIKIELDTKGNLNDAWIHLPSGNKQLDTSVLHAVRSVNHYPIPKSEILNRYFRKLKYYYNGS